MSKTQVVSSSEDDDIWDYKSVPKKIRATQEVGMVAMSQSRKKSWLDDVLEVQSKKNVKRKRKTSNVLNSGIKHNSQSAASGKTLTKNEIINSYTQTLCSQRQGNKSIASKAVLKNANRCSKNGTERKHKAQYDQVNVKTGSFTNIETESAADGAGKVGLKAPSASTSAGELLGENDVARTVEMTPDKAGTSQRTGRCPVCQMPFSALSVVQSPSWHVDECLDVPYTDNSTECSHGLGCDSTIASHYKKFRHRLLSRSHRKTGQQQSQPTACVTSAMVRLSFGGEEVAPGVEVPMSKLSGVAPESPVDTSPLHKRGNDHPDNASAHLANSHSNKTVENDLTKSDSDKENNSMMGCSATASSMGESFQYFD